MPRTTKAYDPRLLGTWRSDRRRTARDIEARHDIPRPKKTALLAIFGHLTLRYTRARCYSSFHGKTESLPYRVVARNSDGVVVVSQSSPAEDEQSIQHIRFDDLGPRPEHYWVALGPIREYFRRIKTPPNKQMQRTKRAQAMELRR
jgi:hypothetical protein